MFKKLIYVFIFMVVHVIFGFEFLYTDLGTAHNVSKIEDKLLIIVFSSPNCYYCKLFEKEVLTNKSVQEFLRGNYVIVKIEPSNYKTTFLGKPYTNNELFGAFGIRGTPTFVFLKGSGVVTQVPGYMPPEDFLKALKYLIRVTEDNYKESFEVYSKKNDDLKGKPKIVNVTKEDANYILKNDKNAEKVDSLPKTIDIYKVYITFNLEIAQTLNQTGVIRTLLVK
ncbi:MAG: thioredoxin fold domain-containing protein [Fervidobacterium sp.]|nr:thioredoxin fold domain-containing protein [Fervidobacterium sp.]